jgi:hypothetical protein
MKNGRRKQKSRFYKKKIIKNEYSYWALQNNISPNNRIKFVIFARSNIEYRKNGEVYNIGIPEP